MATDSAAKVISLDVNEVVHPQRVLVTGVLLCLFSFAVTYSIFHAANHANYPGHDDYALNMLSDTINHQVSRHC